MADIRIKDLATTASSTASDDFLAVDGTTNGTRKLNAYSPTFGGNVVATGTLTVNSTTDSSSKDTGAIVTEGGLGVEKSATIGGNLTVSGTGAVTGNLNFGAKLVGNNDATNYYIGDSAGRLKINWYGGIDLVTETTTNNVKIPSTVASSSTTTGALIVSGGVGVAGAINAGGNLTVSGTGNSTIAGNLGMGATPSAWQSSIYRVVEFPNGVSLSGQVDAASMELATNAYINSSFLWTYKTTAEATRYRQNGGEHRFFVAPSGTAGTEPSFTQAATIKNNGNVLIGKTTPDTGEKLQVSGTAAISGALTVSSGSLTVSKTSNDSLLKISTTGAGAYLQADSSADGYMGIQLQASGVNKWSLGALNGSANFVVARSGGDTNRYFELDTSGNATFAGKVQVGTSSVTGAQLVVVGPASASARTAIIRSVTAGDTSYSAGLFSKYDNDSTTSQVFVQFSINNDGTASGQINANGASQAAFGSWSDARLKKNIVSLGSQWNAIKSLRPVEFDYIESEGGGHQIGFIAQEVQPIYSDVVGTRPDGMFTLSGMGKNEARLIKALQEAMLRIEALEAKLA